jgi:putative endonuclease
MAAWLYILRLQSGLLYVGSTTDLVNRYQEHQLGKACRTTAIDPPSSLLYSEKFETNIEARRREAQVKRWSRAKKEALISGDLDKLKSLSKSREKR